MIALLCMKHVSRLDRSDDILLQHAPPGASRHASKRVRYHAIAQIEIPVPYYRYIPVPVPVHVPYRYLHEQVHVVGLIILSVLPTFRTGNATPQ